MKERKENRRKEGREGKTKEGKHLTQSMYYSFYYYLTSTIIVDKHKCLRKWVKKSNMKKIVVYLKK